MCARAKELLPASKKAIGMAIHRTTDPRSTEKYLRAQPDVLEARVWIERGELRARVILLATSTVTAHELRLQCACELGLSHTPRRFSCELAVPNAA